MIYKNSSLGDQKSLIEFIMSGEERKTIVYKEHKSL